MASRKEQKEQARAERLAREQAAQAQAARTRRMQMIIGVVLAAVIVVGAAIAISSGGGGASATGLQKGKAAGKTADAVQTLLAGIPQSGARLGNPKAPVTMTYYGDLECPICQEFTLSGGFPELVAKDVRSGKVQVVYRAFETATHDPTVFKTQQVAALAAGQQQKFWNFAELFYHEQGTEDSGYVNDTYLSGLAKQITGLDLSKWTSARNNSTLTNQVLADEQLGTRAGVQGTPTLVFQGPKGSVSPSSSVPSYSDLQKAITQVS